MKNRDQTMNNYPIAARSSFPCRRRARSKAGMTLPELLLALAVTAILLAATAVAFDAALRNYETNRQLGLASMSTRNAVHQMCSTIRSAWNDPDEDMIIVSTDGNECDLVNADDQNVIYRYYPDDDEIKMTNDGGTNWYTLLRNIVPLESGEPIFTALDPLDADLAAGTVGRVEIRFQVDSDVETTPVSVAAVPRNILYN